MKGKKKQPLNDREKAAQQLIVAEVEKAVDLLQSHLEKFCSDHRTDVVHISLVKSSVKIMLDSYKKAAEKA